LKKSLTLPTAEPSEAMALEADWLADSSISSHQGREDSEELSEDEDHQEEELEADPRLRHLGLEDSEPELEPEDELWEEPLELLCSEL